MKMRGCQTAIALLAAWMAVAPLESAVVHVDSLGDTTITYSKRPVRRAARERELRTSRLVVPLFIAVLAMGVYFARKGGESRYEPPPR